MKTCDTCDHAQMVYRHEWQGERLRCMRDRILRLGPIAKAMGVGTDVRAETDSIEEPHRVPGDKCGPERRHWRKREN